MWIQDFPLAQGPAVHTDFSRPLSELLVALNTPAHFFPSFNLYDYSASRDTVKLVVSHRGIYTGWPNVERGGGINSLARAVKAFNFRPGGRMVLECQGSSLGRLPNPWLHHMLAAANGISPQTYYTKANPLPPLPAMYTPPIKIVYPTLEDVQTSIGGMPGGGTLFCQRGSWTGYGDSFQHLFHKAVSRRTGLLSHVSISVIISFSARMLGADFLDGSHPSPSPFSDCTSP